MPSISVRKIKCAIVYVLLKFDQNKVLSNLLLKCVHTSFHVFMGGASVWNDYLFFHF